MRRRSVIWSAVALLGIIAGLFATAPKSGASPQIVFVPPHIVKKVILNETSIDGPSLWFPNIVSGEPGIGTGIAIAWTGTDAAHRLNTVQTHDGSSFFNKRTYNETSFAQPAVTMVSDGAIVLAWTGTNAGHSLNVLCSQGCGPTARKLTLRNESSNQAPALVGGGAGLVLAWTGTDANHSLNVLPINLATFTPGVKTVLRQFNSLSRPSLAFDPNTRRLILAWTFANPAQRIGFATSTNGAQWTTASTSPLDEWSDVGPSILALGILNMPHHFLTWAGIDPHHSVNVRYTVVFPSWPIEDAKSTFGEWALGAPSLSYGGVYRQVVVGWTGTDPLHHLNIAMVDV